MHTRMCTILCTRTRTRTSEDHVAQDTDAEPEPDSMALMEEAMARMTVDADQLDGSDQDDAPVVGGGILDAEL